MAVKITITPEYIREVMQSDPVREALRKRRDRIAQRAQVIADNEDVDANVRTEEGTRPRGRPYARVLADAEQEFGTSRVARRRVLGRAAEEA